MVCATGNFESIKAENAPTNLTKEQAVSLALDSNIQNLKISTAIDTITRNVEKYREISEQLEKLEKGFYEYKSAYAQLNSAENKAKYAQLQAIKAAYENAQNQQTRDAIQAKYGYTEVQIDALLKGVNDNIAELNAAGLQLKAAGLVDDNLKPKDLTEKEKYNMFVYPENIPVVLAGDMFKKANLQKKVINCAVDVKVKQGYDAILYAQDGYALTEKLYDKQLKDYNQLVVKYQVGVTSELEKNVAEIELKKSKLQLDNLKRQVENGKIQIKQTLGVDMANEYNFIDEKLYSKDPLSYNEYLGSALKNRAEILAAQIDVDEKQTIFDLVEVFFEEDDIEYEKADQELSEVKSNYEEVRKEVEIEIQNFYLAVKQKQSDKQLTDLKLQQANNQYNSVKATYDAGLTTISMMWNVELAVNQAQMNNIKALRDYNDALYELQQNCNIGTKYVMKGVN